MTQSSVVVEGADALSYLDSQCTQDLSTLEVDDHARTLVLDPAGNIVTVAVVTRTGTSTLVLDVSSGTAEATVARLERFAIRADVSFSVLEGAGAEGEELERIDAGIPGAVELAHGLVPHGIDPALRAASVSFTKGCYPGQELVARMESRHATPPYVLRRISSDEVLELHDPVGDPERSGEVTSIAAATSPPHWHGLCVLHRRDAEGGDVEVHSASGVFVARLS